jgi:hypothetical protein
MIWDILELHSLRGNTTSIPLVKIMKPKHGTFKECIPFFVACTVSVKVPEFSMHIDPSVHTFLRGFAEEKNPGK